MKNFKYILSLFLLITTVIGCSEEDDLPDVSALPAPTNVAATITIAQDNSGLVTITPIGENVANFRVNYGDGSGLDSGLLDPGESAQNTYAEGTYEIVIAASGINGKTTTIAQTIVVSFQAPENLVVTIENDPSISKQVNVTAAADFAISYEVDFGDAAGTIIMSNIDDVTSFTYDDAGIYTITVTAFSGSVDTISYSEDFEVTEILVPLVAAPTAPTRQPEDVISIYSVVSTGTTVYADIAGTDFFPDWGQQTTYEEVDVAGDLTIKYGNLNYQGIQYGETVDASTMEMLHIDIWTADASSQVEIYPISIGSGEQQVTKTLTPSEWNSFDIPLSDFTDQGLTLNDLHQFKFVGTGTIFLDNIYYYKAPSTTASIAGTWKMAEESGSLGVGPTVGDTSWFACDAACVTARACYFDDTYVFGTDGSFMNVLGADTWIEGWQGGADNCGAPVAPHDGSAAATYTHDQGAGTVTINGAGAYIGIPKANNQGELPNVAVPNAITYNVTFIDDNTISVTIESGAGVFWQYKLVREGAVATPLTGTWQMAQEAGSLGVGPTVGDTSWFACDDSCVTARACYFDDTYVFGADGSFMNVLGADTWIEGWQGGADNCGAPVAPHDGSGAATYTYDSTAETVTLNGSGAYIGLPKANNQGELPNVAVPNAITYNISFVDANTINVNVEAGAGVFWQYKLVKL